MTGAIAQMMGLIDDDKVKIAGGQALGMFTPARCRQRGDDTLLVPEHIGVVAQQGVVGCGAGDVEFGLQLFAPLSDQRGRGEHQHALGHPAQQILLENHAGLDGLAQADLVGEQHPAAELLEHLAHGLDLMPESLDSAKMRKTKQLVEALRQAEMGETLAQRDARRRRARAAWSRPREGPQVEFGGEGNVDVDAW